MVRRKHLQADNATRQLGAFLCPFPKVKISLGCVLGYNCIHMMPGVPDMSKVSTTRHMFV